MLHTQENHAEPARKLVTVLVDKEKKLVKPGVYIVADFKLEVGVDASRELDQIINGAIKPLADDAKIEIRGGETFISHRRTGGAS